MSDRPTSPFFDAWAEALEARDRSCPWPGPRPFSPFDARSLLVGREDDASSFRHIVEQHRLVLLDGESGVGKSSLLQARLLPELARTGFAVSYVSDWTDDGTPEPVDFLVSKVRNGFLDADHRELIARLSDGPGFFEGLDTISHDGQRLVPVIVLDQFEELLRYSEDRGDQLLDILVVLNHHFDAKVVVSFRSEYLHRFRNLERQAKPYTFSKYALLPILDDFAYEVINAGNTDVTRAIESDAARYIADQWTAAREPSLSGDDTLGGGIGLLHLQALLYALHAKDKSPPVSVANVHDFEKDGSVSSARGLFKLGIAEAVNVKLERCAEACADLDPYLAERTRQLVALAAPQLSSGGFKLHRELGDLLTQTMGDELRNLLDATRLVLNGRPGAEPALLERVHGRMLRTMVAAVLPRAGKRPGADEVERNRAGIDVLVDPWWTVVEKLRTIPDLEEIGTWISALGGEVTGAAGERSCGPLMGMSPLIGLIEETRRFVFAVAWMQRSALIRLSTPAPETTVVSLIHDRFGEGLSAWSKNVTDSPASVLHAITAPEGASYEWSETIGVPTGDDETEHRVLVNLRWRGAWISAAFRKVIFVNCDFRGTMFAWCSFEGVAFVNCLLDGVIFSDSTITGSAPDSTGEWSPDPGRFSIPVGALDRPMLDAFSRYRIASAPSESIYSPVPGLPAIPGADVQQPNPDSPLTEWTPPERGLLLLGGRMSTMVFRSTTFERCGITEIDGRLSFRNVAGSGLDIVEQSDGGSIEISGSALRHVTLTAAPRYDVAEAARAATSSEPISMEVGGSSVAQLWVGEGLSGSLTIDNCRVVQVWNGSVDIDAVVKNSQYHGLVGCTTHDSASLVEGGRPFSIEEVDVDRAMRDRGAAMDYVRDPAVRYRTTDSIDSREAGLP